MGQGGREAPETHLTSPTSPRENTLLLESQPGRGGGSGHVRGNCTGSAKPLPSRPAALGVTTEGWLTRVFTGTLALGPAQLLAPPGLKVPAWQGTSEAAAEALFFSVAHLGIRTLRSLGSEALEVGKVFRSALGLQEQGNQAFCGHPWKVASTQERHRTSRVWSQAASVQILAVPLAGYKNLGRLLNFSVP